MAIRLTLAVFLLSLIITALRAAENADDAESFEVASARFEQNATDHDVEAVFEAIAGDDGLSTLTITAPDGRAVVDFKAPDGSTMGIRQFRFESPEPSDVAALKKALPEGEYSFAGATSSGTKYRGKSKLSHKLPEPSAFISFKPDAPNAPSKNLRITWKPVKGIAGYTLELEPSRSSAHLEVKLPASATSFVVPEGILAPNARCQVGIGTVSADGNASIVETTITAPAK